MINKFKVGVTYTAVWESDLAFRVMRVSHENAERFKLKVMWINISDKAKPHIIDSQNIVIKREHLERYTYFDS